MVWARLCDLPDVHTTYTHTHTLTLTLSLTYTPTRRVHSIWPSSSCRSLPSGPSTHRAPPSSLPAHNPALGTSHHPSQRLDYLPPASKPLLELLLLPADGTLTVHQRDTDLQHPHPHLGRIKGRTLGSQRTQFIRNVSCLCVTSSVPVGLCPRLQHGPVTQEYLRVP